MSDEVLLAEFRKNRGILDYAAMDRRMRILDLADGQERTATAQPSAPVSDYNVRSPDNRRHTKATAALRDFGRARPPPEHKDPTPAPVEPRAPESEPDGTLADILKQITEMNKSSSRFQARMESKMSRLEKKQEEIEQGSHPLPLAHPSYSLPSSPRIFFPHSPRFSPPAVGGKRGSSRVISSLLRYFSSPLSRSHPAAHGPFQLTTRETLYKQSELRDISEKRMTFRKCPVGGFPEIRQNKDVLAISRHILLYK